MLKPRHIILALLLAMTGDLLGQSQRPPPSATDQGDPQQPSPKNNQEAAQPDLRGTQQAPFIIRNSKGNEESTKDERDRQDKAFNDHVTIFLSAFVALGTSLQAIALFMIIRTTRRQLRAYIGVSVKRAPELNVGTLPRMILSYKNFGQTPAREVRYWVNMIIEPHPSTPQFELRPFTQERLTINPAELEHIDVRADHILTQNEFDAVHNDAARIYTYGELCYFDVFGKPQSTPFRLMHGGQRMIQIQGMARCAEGNSAT